MRNPTKPVCLRTAGLKKLSLVDRKGWSIDLNQNNIVVADSNIETCFHMLVAFNGKARIAVCTPVSFGRVLR